MFFIIQRPWKTSKIVFQSVISIWNESRWSETSSNISEKCQIWVKNFDENFFSSNFFLILYCNVNTFRIIHKTGKAFIVVSQAVNDTPGSAHELQGSLKTHEIVKFRSKISINIFFQHFVFMFCITMYNSFTSHRCHEEIVNFYHKWWKILERYHNVFKVLQSR